MVMIYCTQQSCKKLDVQFWTTIYIAELYLNVYIQLQKIYLGLYLSLISWKYIYGDCFWEISYLCNKKHIRNDGCQSENHFNLQLLHIFFTCGAFAFLSIPIWGISNDKFQEWLIKTLCPNLNFHKLKGNVAYKTETGQTWPGLLAALRIS